MRKLLVLLLIALVAVVGWYFGSQYYAVNDLRSAARDGDAAALDRRVDFPALQAALSAEIEADIAGRVERSDSPLARIGGAIAGELSNAAVERLVTPENVAQLIAEGQAAGIRISREENPQWTIKRSGLNSFRLVAESEDGEDDGALVFHRRGLGWQLTGLERADA